jgi:hypothetical protein
LIDVLNQNKFLGFQSKKLLPQRCRVLAANILAPFAATFAGNFTTKFRAHFAGQ